MLTIQDGMFVPMSQLKTLIHLAIYYLNTWYG